ncbi:MAG: hypothetical protein A3E84_01495 [Gammaproteobacteria bacterium RIFCSPHIGHO2_12_FULL_42_13]|nr:MAG: hypothetical protein A3E84_01495 [Gammaproteobacteria bacterium RIFCSPHIGHO2_12_FULL_42_13]
MKHFFGFSLIELVVSSLILSFLLLGTNAMVFHALYKTESAYYFQISIAQMNNITERLRSLTNKQGVAEQVRLWNEENKITLPQGTGKVTGEFPLYRISIYWGGMPTNTCQSLTIGSSGCLHNSIKI